MTLQNASLRLWTDGRFIIATPQNPHLSLSEGPHLVIIPVRGLSAAWDDPALAGEAFTLATRVAKIVIDSGLADWINIQYNDNWGLLPGRQHHFHVHIYGRRQNTRTWGQPVQLPSLPGTFKHEPMPTTERKMLIRKLANALNPQPSFTRDSRRLLH